ncbi:uncharacterized protein epsti1 [Syngnathoides biaculeatus]|uniref:uncharacterized protein epsti1 n=1 Tax=Syngnathoides biaculeatus TaxID=300417 RepID=UPI002ADDC0F3|nr:uncharacterized protein epsti1 [Syngnathoides biaculeatus]
MEHIQHSQSGPLPLSAHEREKKNEREMKASRPICRDRRRDRVCSSNCSLSSFCSSLQEICVAVWTESNASVSVRTMCHNPALPLDGAEETELLLGSTSNECQMTGAAKTARTAQPAVTLQVCACRGEHECNDKLIFRRDANGLPSVWDKDVIPAVLVSLVPLVVALAIVATLYWTSKRQSRKRAPSGLWSPLAHPDPRGKNTPAAPSGTPKPGQADRSPAVQMEAAVGGGRFVRVWRARLLGESPNQAGGGGGSSVIAVKVFPRAEVAAWRHEGAILADAGMQHRNIVPFLGAQVRGGAYWLLLAYHRLGNLRDFLTANVLGWKRLLTMATGLARGLAHLHSDTLWPSGSPKLASGLRFGVGGEESGCLGLAANGVGGSPRREERQRAGEGRRRRRSVRLWPRRQTPRRAHRGRLRQQRPGGHGALHVSGSVRVSREPGGWRRVLQADGRLLHGARPLGDGLAMPRRQSLGGVSVIAPIESRRNRNRMIAEKEEEELQKWKEAHRLAHVHTTPQRLGGHASLAQVREKQLADLRCSKIQKKLKQETLAKNKRQEEEDALQWKKDEQRQKAERLEQRKTAERHARRENLRRDHARVNSAFLDKLDRHGGGSPERRTSEAPPGAGGRHGPGPRGEDAVSGEAEESDRDEYQERYRYKNLEWALMKLMAKFPNFSRLFLEDILDQCSGDYLQAYALLEGSMT